MNPLSLAFSPCPNDTFIFHALVHGRVPGAPPVEVTYADVDVTNTAVERGEFDVAKVSYAALPWLLETYELLPCGGALGRGCGPLVLAAQARTPESLAGAVIAVPGERTTACLLFRLWSAGFAPARIEVMPFPAIMPAVREGAVDGGLVIHEARFTYRRHGLHAVADLGEWWEKDTGLPIPLGAIVARRDLAARAGVSGEEVTAHIRGSLRAAWADPAASREYVMAHAQEMDPEVAAAHIALYVNEYTERLGDTGFAAAEALLGRAADARLVPPLPRPLRDDA